MACTFTTLHTSPSSSLPPPLPTSPPLPPPSLSFFTYTKSPNSKCKSKTNSLLSLTAIQLRRPSVPTAVVGETATASSPSQPTDVHDNIDVTDGEKIDPEDPQVIRAMDKLIGVFMVDMPTPTDWRRLLAFSREWENYRPHFFRHCQKRADSEDDPGRRHNLLRFARKLKEIDEDVQRHDELIAVVKNASVTELTETVAKRRKDFTEEFFEHLVSVRRSYQGNPTEYDAFTKLVNECIAAVQAYDSTTESIEAVKAAEIKLQDIVSSPTLDAACRKIDDLAARNQLDPTLVLMITKAWSAAKETSITKDEVKDVMYHLYMRTVINLQRSMPKDVQILKYLLTMKDPDERLCALKDAFTPGEESEDQNVDFLYTTPEKLHTLIRTVVDAYHSSQEGTVLREARDLMAPATVKKLEELKKIIEDEYM